MSNLTANEMYQEKGSGDHCVEEILAGIRHVKEQCRNLIIVTNEIFSDGIDYDEETRRSDWTYIPAAPYDNQTHLHVLILCNTPVYQIPYLSAFPGALQSAYGIPRQRGTWLQYRDSDRPPVRLPTTPQILIFRCRGQTGIRKI